jgi:hypothetical protein
MVICLMIMVTLLNSIIFRFRETMTEEMFRVFYTILMYMTVIFKIMGSIFRPKWYWSLLFTSLFFIVTRTLMIYWVEERNIG